MSEEEFITKFYSCDDEEQFLKDVYHNLNCSEREKQRLKGKNQRTEDVLRQILKYCNYLHNDCKYRLNDGHIRKIRKIIRDYFGEDDNEKE